MYCGKLRTSQASVDKLRDLCASRRYQSACVARKKLEQARDEHKAEYAKLKELLHSRIRHLSQYPLAGLPVPSESDKTRAKELAELEKYVEDIRAWMRTVPTTLDASRQVISTLEEEKLRRHEQKKRDDEAAKRKAEARASAQLNAAKLDSHNAIMKEVNEATMKLQERMTDLEIYFNQLRDTMPTPQGVTREILVQKGYIRQPERHTGGFSSDAPVPPPRVAKSSDELAEACTTLQGQLEELTESIEKRLTQLKVQRERNLVRDREYHELALENKDLAIAISRVGLFNVSHFRVLNVLS